MKDTSKKLLEKVDAGHDWQEGQVRGGTGTRLGSTDKCRACNLERRWFSDSQNSVHDEYSFRLAGETLSLRQAVSRGCV